MGGVCIWSGLGVYEVRISVVKQSDIITTTKNNNNHEINMTSKVKIPRA
jgi:hypothetical protein